MELPQETLRLFSHCLPADLSAESFLEFLVIRLLEDGDTDDLRLLVRRTSQEELVQCFVARGARQLSRRSRCFWSAILGQALDEEQTRGEDLWPL